uniref:Rootletin-like coiled-coil domain-containing protein n=1 Tax=Trichogramma kaykai TaxID=54128 RepID=A0ABD2WUT6_9HYME
MFCPFSSRCLAQTKNQKKDGMIPSSSLAGRRMEASSSRKDSDETTGDEEPEESYSPEMLLKQNYELRHRLEEEAASYKRRLDTYRQAQQHQAALVSRLQAKVLQYKQRCSELENNASDSPADEDRLAPASSSHLILQTAQQTMRDMRDAEQITDLDAAMRKLAEERARSERLQQSNAQLKDQLEESHRSNETLTSDLQKLSSEWDSLREEMTTKEDEWKEEEMAFNEYYASEHARLLNLWRDVVSLKRLFSDMKFTTERDLGKMRTQLATAASDTLAACSSTGFALKLQAMLPDRQRQSQGQSQLQSSAKAQELQLAKDRLEAALTDVRAKDERILHLTRDLQLLQDKCGESEAAVAQKQRIQEDLEILQTALREIAHAVIQDAEARDIDAGVNSQTTPHLHLSPAGPPPKRPTTRVSTIPAFAESTISAVQAALHKYQLSIHELQVKLQTNKEQLSLSRKQTENIEERFLALEEKNAEMTIQLDSLRSQSLHLSQEKEMLQKALDNARCEKLSLDKSRLEYASTIDTLNADYDKLDKLNVKMEKLCRGLEDDKAYLQAEVDRLAKDCDSREASLRIEEERSSKLREEMLSLREDLSKANLARDVLEQQKLEVDSHLSQVEKSKADIELELERVVLDKSDLQELMSKLQAVCLSHEENLARLQEELKKCIDEKNNLMSQCTDQQNDLASLRKELLQAEQTRLDLESEKVAMHEKMKFLEIEKEKVEMELAQVSRERGDLSNQLSILARKKEALNEELMRLKQRFEQAGEMNARINRSLEDLVKDNEEKQVMIESGDKEIQRLQEILASTRSEKETLEAILFETQSNLEGMHSKKLQLEKEQQELLIKQESLKGQILRLTKELENSEKHARDIKHSLTQLSENQEAEFQNVVLNLKKQSEEAIKKLNEEKEQIKVASEKKLQMDLSRLENEKDNELSQLNQRMEELQQHIENVCQQHEEVLLRAENDKQQALLIAHQDQQVLMDKLENVYRELEGEKGTLDRFRRESACQAEQDRNSLNKMRDELNRIKSKIDETKLRSEEEKLKLELKIEEVRNERDSAVKENEELQVQLHMSEDKVDELHNQLQETVRKLKEGEVTIETSRKDLVDVRRQLTDSNYEKEKYNSSNKELRERIKQIESEKREQARTLEEVYQKMAGLEEARTALDSDRNRLQSNIRESEREILQLQQQLRITQEDLTKSQNLNNQAQNTEKEIQGRLANEIEERERLHLQLHQMKKQVVDLENSLEVTRMELGKLRAHHDEEDERARGREQELLVRLEEARCRERKLEDQKHNLEVCLADASQQLQELKARLGGSEGRVRALDAQLSQLDAHKKELEQKLSSIVLILRRIAGIQFDGSVSMPFKVSPQQTRRFSPARGGCIEVRNTSRITFAFFHTVQEPADGNREVILDVDPEAVRRGVKALMQQVAQIERERDDCKTELSSTRKQLLEAQENQMKIDSKLSSLVASMRSLQDEKNSMETKLMQKSTLLQQQTEKLQDKTSECDRFRERVMSLELAVSGNCDEKTMFEDKIEKLKQMVNKLENDKRTIKEELSKSENRATQMEVHRMSLEGDLQRLQMIIQEKESNIQKLQDRCDTQARTITTLEERCSSLKSTVEQMNRSLESAASAESDMKCEINQLHRSLIEFNAHSQSDTEKMKQLQKQLSTTESERRVLAERLENVQSSLCELRHANQMLSDQNARLQNEVSNSEVLRSGLEAQLRLSSWPSDSRGAACSGGAANYSDNKDHEEITRQLQQLQRERSELKTKLDLLTDKVKGLENDKRNLERQVSSSRMRSKSYERPEKILTSELSIEQSLNNDQLEQENRELRAKVRRLEKQLADREAEISRLKAQVHSSSMLELTTRDRSHCELERSRAAQLQAEKLLEAREQSHRQQVIRLESQIHALREQLNQEIKRRQLYVLRSSRAGREMQQIRQALGDSLRTVSQDPSLDAVLLEHEARKLDCTMATTASLPASFSLPLPSSTSMSLDRARSPLP